MKKLKNLMILLAIIGMSNIVNAEVIHIYMSESIDGNTYYRNNIGDTFVLHWGADPSGANDPGVYDWDWYDSNGVFDGDPNETTTLAADFVDYIQYDQSSTETGYSYGALFYIEDPVVNTYDAVFTVTDASTSNAINGATVSVTGETNQSTNSSGNCTFSGLADGTYSYTVSATGYDAVSSSFTVSGSNIAVNVQMTENSGSGVSELKNEFSAFPNPCVNFLVINTENNNVQWSVYSIIGQFIKAGTGKKVGISNLNAGYYMLKIKTDEKSVIKKILKQ